MAYIAPVVAHRPAFHKGKAHTLARDNGHFARWRRHTPEFIALINYGIIGLIQLEKGFTDTVDITPDEAIALYDVHAKECLELMLRKNHDYNEAWRDMRISSYTDFILTKIQRIKEIEGLDGKTLVSEGIDSNYMDIINYACFGAIKMAE